MTSDLEIVRDTFTLLRSDSERLLYIRKKCFSLGLETNKSELMRAGLASLATLSEEKLIELLAAVPKIKVGRKKASARKP